MTTSRHARRAFAPLLPLLLLCAAATDARAQRAYKVDETDYTRCDLSEVLQVGDPSAAVFDALAGQPGAKAAVVVHASQPGEALSYARHVRRWLTERMGVAAERLSEVYGGFAGKKRLELWLVPAGAEPPRGARAVARDGVALFDTYAYYSGESCHYEREDALAVFAETLKRLPGWRGTLVVRPHLNRRGLKPSDEGWDEAPLTRRKALRQAADDRRHLVRQLGLPPGSIRAVVGAPSDWSRAELWLVPPAAQGEGFRFDFR
jgi:hypothetical protein